MEIEPQGTNDINIVWEWYLWDHLIQDFDSSKANYGIVEDHPELLDVNFYSANGKNDWLHCNSIDYNEDLDQIVISSRALSELYIIDHSTTTLEAASHNGGQYGKGGDFFKIGDYNNLSKIIIKRLKYKDKKKTLILKKSLSRFSVKKNAKIYRNIFEAV